MGFCDGIGKAGSAPRVFAPRFGGAEIRKMTAIAVSTQAGLSGLTTNGGPHGFTEILFGYTSCFINNGQPFAGLNANTPFYNLTTALAMMVGRFGLAIPALAFAALFGRQRNTPTTSGTLPTHSFVFALLLTTCLIVVVALSYLPSLALGPALERPPIRKLKSGRIERATKSPR